MECYTGIKSNYVNCLFTFTYLTATFRETPCVPNTVLGSRNIAVSEKKAPAIFKKMFKNSLRYDTTFVTYMHKIWERYIKR